MSPQRRNAIVTAVALAAMAVGIYFAVVMKFLAR